MATCEVKRLYPELVEKLVRARADREGKDEEWIRREVERMKNVTAISCRRRK